MYAVSTTYTILVQPPPEDPCKTYWMESRKKISNSEKKAQNKKRNPVIKIRPRKNMQPRRHHLSSKKN